MTEPIRYTQAPVELPLDSWLYSARPVVGCKVCEEAETALVDAKQSGNAWARFEAARTIRRHPHGEADAV